MISRQFHCLIASLLVLIGLTASAEADCGDANPIISRVLCSDDKLRGLESAIQASYQAALSSSSASDRPFLEAEQSGWLSRRRSICSKTTEPGSDRKSTRLNSSHGY